MSGSGIHSLDWNGRNYANSGRQHRRCRAHSSLEWPPLVASGTGTEGVRNRGLADSIKLEKRATWFSLRLCVLRGLTDGAITTPHWAPALLQHSTPMGWFTQGLVFKPELIVVCWFSKWKPTSHADRVGHSLAWRQINKPHLDALSIIFIYKSDLESFNWNCECTFGL